MCGWRTPGLDRKRRREEAIANATGLRVLSAIGAAVPVRLMKRDLLFVAERLANLLDENRAAILARQHGIKKTKENDSIGKLFVAFLRRADESTLGRAVVEAVVLLTAARGNASHVLRNAAEFLQGGRGRNHDHGQAGIRRQGKGESGENGHTKASRKSTDCVASTFCRCVILSPPDGQRRPGMGD
jgi:ParB family chromosome partitioning protein